MKATWRTASVLVLVLVMVALCAPGWCAKIWDPGTEIAGALGPDQIEIAISTETDSTDTCSVLDVLDCDHWVDSDESQRRGTQGSDYDTWAGWMQGGCWWGCTGGSVTQGDLTTTWTAPTDGGAYKIGCTVQDLPKQITAPESGTRDDTGLYVDTPDDYPPLAVEASILAYDTGNVEGPKRFYDFAGGEQAEDRKRGPTDPSTPMAAGGAPGFYKRVELVATIVGTPPKSGSFDWYQQVWGEFVEDGVYLRSPAGQSPFRTWTDDGDQPWPGEISTHTPVNGKLFMVDWPGTPRPWAAGDGERTYRFSGIDGEGPFRLQTRLKFKGRWCVREWTGWTRDCRLHSGAATGHNWVVDTND